MGTITEYLENNKKIFESSDGNIKYYQTILRAFRRAFNENSTDHYVYLTEAGINLYESNFLKINILIGYLYSKNVMLKGSDSFGLALKKLEKKDKFLNSILNCSFDRLLDKIKNLSSQFQSKNIKIDPYDIEKILINWESQSNHKNRNWVKKSIVENFKTVGEQE